MKGICVNDLNREEQITDISINNVMKDVFDGVKDAVNGKDVLKDTETLSCSGESSLSSTRQLT